MLPALADATARPAGAAAPATGLRRARRRARVVLVTPALAAANNGNWHTARRWAAFLGTKYDVSVQREWDGSPADAMVALHARRSAGSIERFAAGQAPVANLAVVLTGTDLYRDIRTDAAAQRSLAAAGILVVLNARGAQALPEALRPRARTIFQSAPTLAPAAPRARTFDLLLVGHARAEKDPMTAVRALARLPEARLRLRHVGARQAADGSGAALGEALAEAAARDARIELLGALPHARARGVIRRGRVLLLPSTMEGGANVLIEAVTCGVPVLASRIDGSVGMLGEDYPGYFAVGDDAALAALIARCAGEQAFLQRLRAACAARAPLFAPDRERSAVRALVDNLLSESRRSP